jgi:hypothetical protein
MTLNYWMLGTLGLVWIASMVSMYRKGFFFGHNQGVVTGSTNTLNLLERHNILTEESYTDLIMKLREEGKNE